MKATNQGGTFFVLLAGLCILMYGTFFGRQRDGFVGRK